jgi:hypothetical protein
MRIKPGPQYLQPLLLDVAPDKEFGTNGAARTYYGAVVQEAACCLLGIHEIQNSGNFDVVFDGACPYTGMFFEIKSVHQNNKAPLYVWRRQKEAACGVPMLYAFVLHRIRGVTSIRKCWEALGLEMRLPIVLLPLHVVDALCEGVEVRQLVKEKRGSRMGYERAGYCEGYQNLSVAAIRQAVEGITPIERSCVAYGVHLDANVFIHPEAGWVPRGETIFPEVENNSCKG